MKKWYLLVFFALLLVGCRTEELDQPEPTETVQAAETMMPTVTATTLPTSTTTPVPTSTPEGCPTWDYDTEVPDPDFPKNYIGMHLNSSDLPPGLLLLAEGGKTDTGLGGMFARWHENREIYFLVKLVCHDEAGKPYHQVVDAFATPPLTGEEFVSGACFDGNDKLDAVGFGYFDHNMTILIEQSYGYPSTEIIYLYYVDTEVEKFVFLDADDFDELICIEDPGSGTKPLESS